MKANLLFTVIAIASLGACANKAEFNVHDGSYAANGRSTNPEQMVTALSTARTREMDAETRQETSRVWSRYYGYHPYAIGCQGGYDWCSRTYWDSQLAAQTIVPQSDGVTRGELDTVDLKAEDAKNRANDALRMHQKVRAYLEGGR